MNSISMDWDAIDSTKAMVIDRPKAKKGLNEGTGGTGGRSKGRTTLWLHCRTHSNCTGLL